MIKHFFKISIIVSGWLLVLGCASDENSLSKLAQKSLNYEFELKTLNMGMEIYQAGDFEKAAEIFENLTKDAANDIIRRKALHGLACTQLILAQNQNEFGDAMVLWENWSNIRGNKLGAEDSRMLSPLFQRIFQTLPKSPAEESEPDEDEDIEEEPEEPALLPNMTEPSKLGHTRKEPGVCSKLLKNREKEIQTLKTSNAKMKKDIQRLKDQINSLEAIHRKIQEKKKEIVP